jgi:hypothetical protein
MKNFRAKYELRWKIGRNREVVETPMIFLARGIQRA